MEFPCREGNSGLGSGTRGERSKTQTMSDIYYGWKVARHMAEWRIIEIG